jgi:hypothetical protein
VPARQTHACLISTSLLQVTRQHALQPSLRHAHRTFLLARFLRARLQGKARYSDGLAGCRRTPAACRAIWHRHMQARCIIVFLAPPRVFASEQLVLHHNKTKIEAQHTTPAQRDQEPTTQRRTRAGHVQPCGREVYVSRGIQRLASFNTVC